MNNSTSQSKCCELCRPNTLEKKAGLDTCRITTCGCHFSIPAPTHDPRMGIEVVKEEEWEEELREAMRFPKDLKEYATDGDSRDTFTRTVDLVRKIRQDVYREAYAQGILDDGKHNEEAAKDERARVIKEIEKIDTTGGGNGRRIVQQILSLLTSKK